MLIGLVALIVIGPERLPKVAKIAGAWLGRLNRYASQVKAEVNRELQLEELRNAQQSMKQSVQKYEILTEETTSKVVQEADDIGKSVHGAVNEAESALSGKTGATAPATQDNKAD